MDSSTAAALVGSVAVVLVVGVAGFLILGPKRYQALVFVIAALLIAGISALAIPAINSEVSVRPILGDVAWGTVGGLALAAGMALLNRWKRRD